MPSPRLLRFAQIAVAVICLVVPMAMFAAGGRGASVDNRELNQRPELDPGSIFDTTVTRAFGRYLDDAFPLRDEAVRASGRVDRWFGDSSNPAVVIGTDGFLFLRDVVDQRCIDDEVATEVDAALRRAERIVTSTGREITFVIAPNKAAIYNDEALRPVCPLVTADGLSSGLLDGRLVTFWDQMRATTAEGVETYRRLDTHWTVLGAAVGAEALLEALEPGLWNDDLLVARNPVTRTGDLTVLLGLPQEETLPQLATVLDETELEGERETFVDRSGAAVPGAEVTRTASTWPEAITDDTLMLTDSYGRELTPLLRPYFASLVATRTANAPDLGYLRDSVLAADRIIWMGSARGIDTTVLFAGLDAQFATAFASELDPVPVSTECNGPCAVTLDDTSITPETHDVYVIATLPVGAEAAQIAAQGRTIRLDDTTSDGGWLFDDSGVLVVDGALDDVEFSAVAVPTTG